jgi:uncharacterized protein
MNDELRIMEPEDHFCFACHSRVSCFNQCCRDLNQALTPYDLLRLRSHLGLSSRKFLQQYAQIHTGPASGLPIVCLRFDDADDCRCPFVTQSGCRVYAARPTSCRLYPLARSLYRSRADGTLSARYAIIKEPHCRGFEQQSSQNVTEWISGQDLDIYFRMNDCLIELISLKNRLRPGPLSTRHLWWAQLALYDIDTLKEKVSPQQPDREFEQISTHHVSPAPDPQDDDEQWLHWSLNWVRHALFGERR